MDHLEDLSVEDLQRALENVEGKRPAQRLLAAIAYKHGVTQTELAAWNGVERKTIYNWLSRLDADSLRDAVVDDHRSGRTRKLTDSQQREFERTVRRPPSAAGYDAPAWTPALAREHLAETYGVEYSLPSCRRLLKEAGLRYERSPETADGTDANPGETSDDASAASRGRWTPQ